MRLVRLELENFRPFAGAQTLELAGADDGRNVTLVHGSNGAGKTTLLNAFTWCLYGTFSPDVEQPDRIVNDWVWAGTPAGAQASASVALTFEHGGSTFRLRRRVEARKDTPEQRRQETQVSLDLTGEDGSSEESRTPTSAVERVLPEQLAQFFFFNGERIERLVNREAYAGIANAIKTLLGLQQFDRAAGHLPHVERRFGKELKTLGDSNLSDLTEQIETLQDRLREMRARLAANGEEAVALGEERDSVDARLRDHGATASLQRQRDDARRDLEGARRDRDQALAERRDQVGRRGYTMLTTGLLPRVVALADDLREKGQLPSPLKRQFVDELLDRGECICGTSLAHDDEHRASVAQWRASAGLAEVESAWQVLAGQASVLADTSNETARRLGDLDKTLGLAVGRVTDLELRLDEVTALLQKVPLEDIQRLEERRRELERMIAAAAVASRDLELDIARAEDKLKEVESRRRRAEVNDDRVRILRRRIEVTQSVAAAMEEMREAAGEVVRANLDSRVRDVYRGISIKNYDPRLDEQFKLSLWDQGLSAIKGTGENQLLSLSFVGALAAYCREQGERAENGAFLGRVGGEYPVVMDAAFGSLDAEYQSALARALPGMAPQVVVLTSRAQGGGVVSAELRDRVGVEYVITSLTTRTDVKDLTIAAGGREYEYLISGADHSGARLVKVES